MKETNLEYIKHNRVRLKEGSQKKVTGIFKEFFESIKGKVKGLKGSAILENIENKKKNFSKLEKFSLIKKNYKTIRKILLKYFIKSFN
jgi:hypothetical protein